MSKLSNILTMLQLLQSGRKYNINELSKEKEKRFIQSRVFPISKKIVQI